MPESVRVIVVGAGSAGLATSHELTARGVEHVVIERSRVGEAWRRRWDSFCLVTPNWTMRLPDAPYDGDDPEGFMPRDEIVAGLERYARTSRAPLHTGVEVERLEVGTRERFALRTSDGAWEADSVVLCTGAYQHPHRPAAAADLPSHLLTMDAADYTNPEVLPEGRVLVVGSGQTGCQLAEEIHEHGRDVTLACGRAPWMPRRAGGRDVVTWVSETSFFDAPLESLPSPEARLFANIQASGRDGGHDLHYRTLASMGVDLVGHLEGVDGTRAHLADDLAESVAFGDARYDDLRALLAQELPLRGIDPPSLPAPTPFRSDPPTELDLSDFSTAIFASGFRPAYARWVDFPAFDEMGFPVTHDGASTIVPGLFFCGVHFLRTRKSSLLFGVGEDAAVVADQIANPGPIPTTSTEA